MKELYAGVDIHKRNFVGNIMKKEGVIVRENSFPPTKEGAQSFFCGMPIKTNTYLVLSIELFFFMLK